LNPNEEQHHKDNIQQALKLCRYVKWLKAILAFAVAIAYFSGFEWLPELMIIALLISLLLPLGFFDVFIQKLLEYNSRLLEERQRLNAEEANTHFDKLYKETRTNRDY